MALSFSSKLDWGFYIAFVAKTSSKEIGALIRSTKFHSPEVARYFCLYKSTKSTISCYFDILDKLQKQIFRILSPWLAASLEPLAIGRNIVSLNLFYRYFLIDIHLNCLNWFHFLILAKGTLIILIISMFFLSLFLDVIGMSMLTVSFFTQLDSEILYLQNVLLSPMILMALTLKLIDTFYLWFFSEQLSHIRFIFFFFFFL